MYKEATLNDIPTLVPMLRKFWAASGYEFPFDVNWVIHTLEELIESPDAVVYFHDHGLIGGAISPVWFSDRMIAQEMFWWASKDGRPLLKAFEDWARDRQVDGVAMIHLSTEDRVAHLYRRRGYKPRETAFFRKFA